MTISFNDLTQMLHERDESSNRLFHWTHWFNQILKDGFLKTSESYGSEIELLPGGIETQRKYGDRFISFARSVSGSKYTRERYIIDEITVYFEFSRDKLRDNYKFFSVNWYKPKRYEEAEGIPTRRSANQTELEDRLVTFKQQVPLRPYLLGIHVYINDDKANETIRYIKNQVATSIPDNIKYYRKRIAELELKLKNPNLKDWQKEDIEWDLKSVRAYLRDSQEMYIKYKKQLADGIETESSKSYNELLEIVHRDYKDIPVWRYFTPSAFVGRRWAEATQVNLNLPDPNFDSDEDEDDLLDGYEDDKQ